jgi:hypothetical protein
MGVSLLGENGCDGWYGLPLEPSVLLAGNSELVEVR